MSFPELADFITKRMRMSHIYQPVMLMTLLQNHGICHESDIAKAILEHDQSQIEYYTRITNNMVGRVLRNHRLVEKSKREYRLVGFEELSAAEIEELIALCEQKLHDYLEARGTRIWTHRKASAGYISGTVRYEVLKRAKFHCELCEISADQKALEVDHILPRNHGGTDDPANLQALCYSCNAMKRDRDDTDFHAIREAYGKRKQGCLFCGMPKTTIIAENLLCYAIYDKFPVVDSHTLIIPKRHVAAYFDLGQAELNACNVLLSECKGTIENHDQTVEGFNIGINNGEVAGQTIFHCHIHLIPRRSGDVGNPRGGIRHMIPGKGFY